MRPAVLSRLAAVTLLMLAPQLAPAPVAAQAQVALGGLTVDALAPVEVTADSLSVDQNTRSAAFAGNVVIIQGDMRIAAERVEVAYAEDSGEIALLSLSGGVTFVTAAEEAEAQSAEYDITSGTLLLSDDVLLSQGGNALAAQRMSINLRDGTAVMEGRVRTGFGQGG